MMSVSNHEYPDIDPTDPNQNVNLRTSKHSGSKSKESKQRKAKNIMLLASMYGAAVGGHSLPGISKDNYPKSRVEKLIDECKQIKEELQGEMDYYEPGTEFVDVKCLPYLVADGGIKNYCDINKALALGADYVMIGGLFGSLLESSADMFIEAKDNAQYPAIYDSETGKVVYYTSYGSVKLNIWN